MERVLEADILMKKRNFLKVKYDVPGFHRWKDAPEGRKYLRNLHRHNFGFIIEIEVTELDREVEYHDLEDICLTESKYMLKNMKEVTQDWSCEHMANYMYDHMRDIGFNVVMVEVSEEWKYCSVVRRSE